MPSVIESHAVHSEWRAEPLPTAAAAALGAIVGPANLLQSIADFTEGMPQTDDITLVIVEKYQ